MPLEHPTQAEQCLALFTNAPRTIALSTIARRMGAEVHKNKTWSKSDCSYIFDDDSELITSGRGKNYKVEALLP
jgi:hypothetical protein